MKARNTIIYSLLMSAAMIAVGSCADHTFDDFGRIHDSYSDLIRFDVSSGVEDSATSLQQKDNRNDEDDGLSPMLLTEGSDTLYLHRYVAPESWRATGRLASTQSRAAQINNITDFTSLCGDDGFMVYAMDVDNNSRFFPLTVAKPLANISEENIWYVSNPDYRYWPYEKKKLRFNAYAPKTAGSSLENLDLTDNTITFDYTAPVYTDADGKRRDAEKQPDLMFASSVSTHEKNADNHTDYVPLNFRHALSSIKFAIRDVSYWYITDISLIGVSGTGSCTFNPDATGSEQLFEWTPGQPNSTFTQTFDYKMVDPYDPDSDDPDHNVPTAPNAPVINDKVPEKTFMLIPQTIPEDAEIQITLTFGDTIKVLKGKLKTSDIPSWEPGKEYVYTISTTPINWTYVFNVKGSKQGESIFDEDTGKYIHGGFDDDDNSIEIAASVTSGSYYKVQSYRYRTNSPDKYEILPWTAVPSQGVNELEEKFEKYRDKIPNMTLPSDKWLSKNWVYEDDGSTGLKKFSDLEFYPQYVATDYDGDWTMRGKPQNGEKNAPLDLSMVYGKLNTANCYMINAGGWYSIPLYYGSSMKNGSTVESTYKNIEKKFTHVGGETVTYESLPEFLDYMGTPIKGPKIPKDNVKDAIIVWQDAYNIIDECYYDSGGDGKIVFHANATNLQQANCVLAIRDNDKKIIWSWHIWVTNHWIKDDLTIDEDSNVGFKAWDEGMGNFYIAPYNLGWCNPKNELYLKRAGIITFTQYHKDRTRTPKNPKTLNVIQRPTETEFWIGNNTYYEFGRKDPMVGFINSENKVKPNYGKLPYLLEKTTTGTTIAESIKKPNVLYINPGGVLGDWLTISYYNLWNNYNSPNILVENETISSIVNNSMVISNNPVLTADFRYSAVKTIYDPSPTGYVVPPVDIFKSFTDGIANPNSSALEAIVKPADFKGIMLNISGHTNFYNYYESPNGIEGGKTVLFNVTGQRLYTNGTNMNPALVYLWSNTCSFYTKRQAYSFALGYDTQEKFTMNAYFPGTKTMARPVRCIKEF